MDRKQLDATKLTHHDRWFIQKSVLLYSLSILLALSLGACGVGTSPEDFPCSKDMDCTPPTRCINARCQEALKDDEEPAQNESDLVPDTKSKDQLEAELDCQDGQTRPCGSQVGECLQGIQSCRGNVWQACQGGKGPEPEICNGKDDNCDGAVDEGFSSLGKACEAGQGECKAKGQTICTRDGKGVECGAKPAPPTKEICDRKDNNCDGAVDEGCPCEYLGKSEGVCAKASRNNEGKCIAPSNYKASEICDDKLDNNCDGFVDEGCPCQYKGSVQGVCKNSLRDKHGKCQVPKEYNSTEQCGDNRDNNCDGVVDEGCQCKPGQTRPCGTDQGECTKGKQTCNSKGRWGIVCVGESKPNNETCNGKDDDCDGSIDNGFPGLGTACSVGKGECKRVGRIACKVDGSGVACNVQPGAPTRETCDGKDNNCDGVKDEGCPCQYLNNPNGVCATSRRDNNGICLQPPLYKASEVCGDTLDNNCDGNVDEGCTCQYMGKTQGVCKTAKINSKGICEKPLAYSSKENCSDQLDNNCNGFVNEGCLCAYMGKSKGVCQSATIGNTGICEKPSTYNVIETCGDRLDNNCDGVVDELCSCQYLGKAKGVCLSARRDQQGKCQPPKGYNGRDLCGDNLDNNCDGSINEGCQCKPGQTQPCGVSQGKCKTGIQTCDGNGRWSLVCVGEVKPVTERCNGKDDDCDGSIDNGFPGLGTVCSVGKGECQRTGKMVCKSDFSGTECSVKPFKSSVEICDGKDNDCEGTIDNGATCSGGKRCQQGRCVCPTGQLGCSGTCVNTSSNSSHCGACGKICPSGSVCQSGVCSCSSYSSPVSLWGQSTGGTLADRGYGIQADSKGNLIVTGSYSGTVWFGPTTLVSRGLTDIFVAKMDSTGNWLWAKSAGGSGSDTGYGLTVDSQDNVLITGAFLGTATFGTTVLSSSSGTRADAFVGKMDPTGKWLWIRGVDCSNSGSGRGIDVDANNNVFVVGTLSGVATFGTTTLTSTGTGNTWIAKLDKSGTWLWTRLAQSTGYSLGNGITVDTRGYPTVAGFFRGSMQPGQTVLASSANSDVFVAQLDSSGKWLWAQSSSGAGSHASYGITSDLQNNIYVTGTFQSVATFGTTILSSKSNRSAFVASLDSTGKWLWAQSPEGGVYASSVAIDAQGQPIIAGSFQGIARFGNTSLSPEGLGDVFVARLDDKGSWLWAERFGGDGYDVANSVTIAPQGSVFLTGDFERTIKVGPTYLNSKGKQDLFVARWENGQQVCSNTCVDLWKDSKHCGSCNQTCQQGNVCRTGRCACPLYTKTEGMWAQRMGSSNYDVATSVTMDSLGNTLVAGYFQGKVHFGSTTLTSAGNFDVFVAKLAPSGTWLWARRGGGSSGDILHQVKVDAQNNVLLTGYFSGTVGFGRTALSSAGSSELFVAKLDGAGNWLWAARAGGTGSDGGYGLSVDSQSSIIVTGFFRTSATFGSTTLSLSNGQKLFVAKLDSFGKWQWAVGTGGSLTNSGHSVAVDDQNNIVVTGAYWGNSAFGTTTLASFGNQDVFVAKLDGAGKWLWAKRAGSSGPDTGHDITIDPLGNAVIVGTYWGPASFGAITLSSVGKHVFVAKLDSSGSWLWAKSPFSNSNGLDGRGITTNAQGQIFITGSFRKQVFFGKTILSAVGDWDVFVAKLDRFGEHLRIRTFGGSKHDEGLGVAAGKQGSVVVAGRFENTLTLDGTTLSAAGSWDAFTAKFVEEWPSCNNLCVNLLTESKHCGACNRACPKGQSCCSGQCKNLQTDDQNCGSCKTSCVLGSVCLGGQCIQQPKFLSTGGYHSCIIATTDKSIRCWGANAYGQLGDGTQKNRATPILVALPHGRSAKQLTAGTSHTCAILDNDSVYCWGSNQSGQIGNGSSATLFSTPTAVSLPQGRTARHISAGATHTCAVLDNGRAYCWGDNVTGQLGDGTKQKRTTPTLVALPNGRSAKRISAGTEYTCAILDDDKAYCWGLNKAGQLGDGTTQIRYLPVQVGLPQGSTVRQLSARYTHTCAILNNNTAYCWGENKYYQLGDSTGTSRPTPVPVSLSSQRSVKQIAVGLRHSCAILDNGAAACWGNNGWGQVGDGTNNNRFAPTTVRLSNGRSAKQIATGWGHSCAILDNDDVVCWGYNNLGQLGNNSIINLNLPPTTPIKF